MIDFSTEFGQRAYKRLSDEEVIWLTTTDAQGNPQPRPVWFLWSADMILIFSQPHAHKVAHIKIHPKVALNLDSANSGEDIVVLLGEAQIDPTPVSPAEMKVYLEKYRQGLVEIKMTESEFKDSYRIAIRVSPTSLRGH
jgi:PPOX class probable F420-dependent enzyme